MKLKFCSSQSSWLQTQVNASGLTQKMSLRVCIHPTESTRSLENRAWADTEEADGWPRACRWEQSPRTPLLALTLLDARHRTAGLCCPWSFSAGHWTLHSTQWPRLIISKWTFAIVSPLKDHASPWRGNICSPFGFIDSAFSPCRGKGGGVGVGKSTHLNEKFQFYF